MARTLAAIAGIVYLVHIVSMCKAVRLTTLDDGLDTFPIKMVGEAGHIFQESLDRITEVAEALSTTAKDTEKFSIQMASLQDHLDTMSENLNIVSSAFTNLHNDRLDLLSFGVPETKGLDDIAKQYMRLLFELKVAQTEVHEGKHEFEAKVKSLKGALRRCMEAHPHVASLAESTANALKHSQNLLESMKYQTQNLHAGLSDTNVFFNHVMAAKANLVVAEPRPFEKLRNWLTDLDNQWGKVMTELTTFGANFDTLMAARVREAILPPLGTDIDKICVLLRITHEKAPTRRAVAAHAKPLNAAGILKSIHDHGLISGHGVVEVNQGGTVPLTSVDGTMHSGVFVYVLQPDDMRVSTTVASFAEKAVLTACERHRDTAVAAAELQQRAENTVLFVMPVSSVFGADEKENKFGEVLVMNKALPARAPGTSVMCGSTRVWNLARHASFHEAAAVLGTMDMLTPGKSKQPHWITMPWSDTPFKAPDYATALKVDFATRLQHHEEGVALHIVRLPNS